MKSKKGPKEQFHLSVIIKGILIKYFFLQNLSYIMSEEIFIFIKI